MYKYLLPFISILLFTSCSSFQPASGSTPKSTTESLRKKIVSYAESFRGRPYKYGGKDPKGFDCSGYTGYVFRKFDIALHASSGLQSSQGNKLRSHKDALPGDLVFFRINKNGTGRINHVGIVSKNKGGQLWVIHSTSRGVVVDHINTSTYWWPRLAYARNVVGRH